MATKKEDIRDFSDKQIKERLADEKQTLVKMKLSHAVSPLENNQRIKHTRKLVARLKTEQKRRELAK